MKQKSKICFQDLHFIILDFKKFDVEKFLERKNQIALAEPDEGNILAEPDEESRKTSN